MSKYPCNIWKEKEGGLVCCQKKEEGVPCCCNVNRREGREEKRRKEQPTSREEGRQGGAPSRETTLRWPQPTGGKVGVPHHHLADSRHQQGQLNPQSCPEPTCWTNFAAKAAIFLPSVQPRQVASDHAIISKRLPTAPTTNPAKIYGRKSSSVVGNPSQSTPSEQGNRREPQFLELRIGQPVSTTATSSRPRASLKLRPQSHTNPCHGWLPPLPENSWEVVCQNSEEPESCNL